MALEQETMTSLRGIAQATGTKWKMDDDKHRLITKIKATAEKKINNIEPPKKVDPVLRELTQKEIYEALEPLFERGLILTFPTPDTWQVEKIIRHVDSGTLWMPKSTVVEAAKKIVGND